MPWRWTEGGFIMVPPEDPTLLENLIQRIVYIYACGWLHFLAKANQTHETAILCSYPSQRRNHHKSNCKFYAIQSTHSPGYSTPLTHIWEMPYWSRSRLRLEPMLRSRRIFCSICASSIDQYWLQPHLFYGTMVANIVRDTGQPLACKWRHTAQMRMVKSG